MTLVDGVIAAPPSRARDCTCPHDDEGVRERAFIEHYDPDGAPRRTWYYLKNPTCPLHGDTTDVWVGG